MKYFIDNENRKVTLAWATPLLDGKHANCLDMDGKEYTLLKSEILDDGTENFIEVSIPIEFPNGFVPPVLFDNGRCMWCPFYCVEPGVDNYCSHKYYKRKNGCPIRKHFIK